jgi:septal ring factor EnvC (AmiA/AmiB activator)
MHPGRKRADAWYAALPDTEMWAAYDVCVRMRPWQRAAAWIREKHGVKVSHGAYYRWLDWCRENALEHTLRDAHRFAEETKRVIQQTGDIDATLQDGVSALALDAASSHDLDSLARLVRGLGQLRKSELETLKQKCAALENETAQLRRQLEDKAGARAAADPAAVASRMDEALGIRRQTPGKGAAHG